jgi:hypothetical protein
VFVGNNTMLRQASYAACRPRGRAAVSKSPSSSQASKYSFRQTLPESTLWKNVGEEDVDAEHMYNLSKLGREMIQDDLSVYMEMERCASEMACAKLLTAVLGNNFLIKAHEKIPMLTESSLSELMNTKLLIPDVSCYLLDDVTAASLVEVHCVLGSVVCTKPVIY